MEHPNDLKNGDYTFVSTKTAKEDAEKLKNNLLPEIQTVEFAAPIFINIFLKKEFFANSVKEINGKGKEYGKTKFLSGQKIFVEHTQPNPFKEFHIGHLMNNTVGESVARILKANAAELKVCSYHGDVGLHVAKSIWAIVKVSSSFEDAYVYGHKMYEEDENVKKEIIELNKNIYEEGDSFVKGLYIKGRKGSLDHFEELYKRLDSHFDFHFYESESGEIGKKIVLEKIGKVFEEGEKGAIIFKGENFEPVTHTRVFLSSEGLPTYEAKEVGLAEMKKSKWQYDQSITVTANEQDSFFKVVEVAIGEVFPELKGKLKHLSHGMLKLPTGKMSSRTGNIITAEALIQEVKEKIFEKLRDRNFDEQEKENIAETVAIGAIKYSILRQAIGGDIIFDLNKSISFEGDSGPYLQYTAVRANSVLAKAPQGVALGKLDPKAAPWETTDLEKMLYRFPEVVERAAREFAPHYLVTYLIELAGEFNSFYAREQIIDESDSSPYKLAITSATATVLKNGLNLLGIKVPERM